jgi:hypothetical protein
VTTELGAPVVLFFMKHCLCCKEDKPLNEFDKNGFTANSVRKYKAECKSCRGRAGKEARTTEWETETVEPTRSSVRNKKREHCEEEEVVHAPLLDLFRAVAAEAETNPSLEHFSTLMSRLLHVRRSKMSHLNVLFVPVADGYHRGELYDAAETIPLTVYRKVLGKEPLTKEWMMGSLLPLLIRTRQCLSLWHFILNGRWCVQNVRVNEKECKSHEL